MIQQYKAIRCLQTIFSFVPYKLSCLFKAYVALLAKTTFEVQNLSKGLIILRHCHHPQ